MGGRPAHGILGVADQVKLSESESGKGIRALYFYVPPPVWVRRRLVMPQEQSVLEISMAYISGVFFLLVFRVHRRG